MTSNDLYIKEFQSGQRTCTLTPYQAKVKAWELLKKYSSSDDDKFTGVLSEAKVDLNPHQVEAALFAFRSPLSKGAILADEVGLGKTIEAALVISQHWAERKRRILIIAPASLRKQWSVELEDKFYLPSIIMEKKVFDQILHGRYANPFENADNIIICSYAFARKRMEHIKKVNWDLVVIDEAHALRNVYRNNRTAAVLKEGLQRFKKLLLTATPLQNDLKELYGIISIIDENYFGDLKSFSEQYGKVALRNETTYAELRERILPIVHRRLRSEVQAYVKYTERNPMVQEYFPSEEEQELTARLNQYLQRPDSFGTPKSTLLMMQFYKYLASSTYAIAGTLQASIERLKNKLNKQVAQESSYVEDFDSYEDMEDEWADEEDEDSDQEEEIINPEDFPKIRDEIKELEELHELAVSISSNNKGACLLNALRMGFEDMLSNDAPQKALIFTESRRTQEYLYRLLEENGYGDKIVLFNGSNNDSKSREIYANWLNKYAGSSHVTGSKTADMRQAIVEHFRDSAQIMIATEAAAEGINLQFCSLIVNYDLPWNPQRVEQRIGRCHRYGQKYDVVVVNFINKSNRADQRVYELLDQKFNLFRGVFGVSDEVLGAIGNGVDFEKRILEIYRQCRTTEEVDRAFNVLQEELKDDIAANMQQTRASLFENFDESVIERLRIRETRESSLLGRYNDLLWQLTAAILGKRIEIISPNEFILKDSPSFTIPTGVYTVDKNNDSAYHYRISHPLAQWVIDSAKRAETPYVTLHFDYGQRNIAIIAQNRGKTGLLAFKVVRYEALNEAEEHIIIVATDNEGNAMDEDFASRLLSLPATIDSTTLSMSDSKLQDILEAAQGALMETLEIRNSEFVDTEIKKLDFWLEDNRKALQKKLDDLDILIEEKDKEFRSERNIRRRLEIQREKTDLNSKRDNAWRDYDHEIRILKEAQNKKIDELMQLADGYLQTVDSFTIAWSIN